MQLSHFAEWMSVTAMYKFSVNLQLKLHKAYFSRSEHSSQSGVHCLADSDASGAVQMWELSILKSICSLLFPAFEHDHRAKKAQQQQQHQH